MLQGFLQSRFMSVFCKFSGSCNNLVYNYKLSLGQMLYDVFHTASEVVLGTLTLTADNSAYIFKKQFTVGVTSQQGMFTPPRHLFPPNGMSVGLYLPIYFSDL
jgi:hypothetical protein